ncbi:hypothetical protein IC614_09220 [Allosphingosinicella flava]|uniref:Inner membrane protein n=1 Tax=Allosphingosinicella flava TaxID=2771430 RepID=A0A7T2GJ74_9SPHN|nr:hypothetical protein [Sphingosinicella flava]QPQ54513.1 hypothetical protein IC614_09220 [Sphingosinicella flava]
MDMTDPAPQAPAAPPQRKRGGLLGPLILAILAFLIGLAAMGWVLTRWDAAADYLGLRKEVRIAVPVATPQPQSPGVAPAADPYLAQRLSLLEQRVTDIANQSQAAVGNADRAEGLLVAFAARRALDRGVALGYLEGLLRQRFGTSQPQAVGTIIAAAREPITLQELQDGLQETGPALMSGGGDRNWWHAFKAELGSLITVRKTGTPSTVPGDRLARATRRLEAGQVDVALAEVLRIPGHEAASGWIADARRYVAARRALDTIETAALLEPRAATAAPPVTPSGPGAVPPPA